MRRVCSIIQDAPLPIQSCKRKTRNYRPHDPGPKSERGAIVSRFSLPTCKRGSAVFAITSPREVNQADIGLVLASEYRRVIITALGWRFDTCPQAQGADDGGGGIGASACCCPCAVFSRHRLPSCSCRGQPVLGRHRRLRSVCRSCRRWPRSGGTHALHPLHGLACGRPWPVRVFISPGGIPVKPQAIPTLSPSRNPGAGRSGPLRGGIPLR